MLFRSKVLLRPEAAEAANKSNVVIGEPRKEAGVKEARRAITLTRQPDGKEIIKITVKNFTLRGQQPQARDSGIQNPELGGQTGFMKPKNPEVGRWKVNQAEYRPRKVKPTFDMLLNKYVHQAGSRMSWQYGKRPRSPSTKRSYRHQDSTGDAKRQVTR